MVGNLVSARASIENHALRVIDIAPLFGADATQRARVASEIARACADHGFFYMVGHGVSLETLATLEVESHRFFRLPEVQKAEIAMSRGGSAWRGWFPLGGELTSGRADGKEGLYLGEDLDEDDPRVAARWPLHGANLWPADAPGLRPAVKQFMAEALPAAHAVARGVSLALGLEGDYLARRYTARPTVLFRIFRYPPEAELIGGSDRFGVGEHTDYGFLTLLAQDELGGLEVKTSEGWIEAPPIRGALVCNIGDMLERLSGGRLRSTPHRVRNRSSRDRVSFPLFFDPAFDAVVEPLPLADRSIAGAACERWDGEDVREAEGTYGEYLLKKVGRVFPDLKSAVLA